MVKSNEKSAYAILGVQKGASFDQVKQAYVEMVKKYDPEKHTDRFMVIQKAFDRLKNPSTRAAEDVRSFNHITGEFNFGKDERTEAKDVQIANALKALQERKEKGEGDPKELDAKLCQALMMRSFRNVKKKLWAEAIEDWEQVLKVDPAHHRAKHNMLFSFITLGYSYANHGLFDEALEVWTKAVQMNPDNVRLIHNLALASEKAGHVDEARRYWDETIKRWKAQLEKEPDNEYLRNCVIEVLRHRGDEGGDAGESEGESGDGADKPKAMGGGGAPKPAASRVAGAGVEELREILKLNPDDFEAHFKLANILMRDKNWTEAAKEFEALRKKYPRNIEVLNMLGWALLNVGRVDDAFMIWRKAKVIDPKNHAITESLIKAHMTMGRTLRESGMYTPCLVHFKALMRYLPEDAEVFYEIGQTYAMKGDERSAYQHFQKTLKLNPKHKGARNGLSSLRLRR